MKVERLMSLLLYLLGHGRISKAKLAEYFEVSTRTIQRDIETLIMIGIPIQAYWGVNGGYAIDEDYKMKNQLADMRDYTAIMIALKALDTALPNTSSTTTLTKIESLKKIEETHLILDFNVLKEKDEVMKHYSLIEEAIINQHIISFKYTNASATTTNKIVDPIGLVYKWYTWYLVGYDRQKDGYRYYKLIRMKDICKQNGFIKPHLSLNKIINDYLGEDSRDYYDIVLKCQGTTDFEKSEYLNGKEIERYSNGDFLYSLHLPKVEKMWKAALILLGAQVEILEPVELKEELHDICQQFIKNNE